MSAVADHVLLWVTTYLLHSTLLLGLTAFLVRFAWLRRPERTEVLWRTALLAGALTATAHVLVGAPVWTTRSLVAVTPPVARVPSPKREVATTTGLSKPVSGRVPALLPSETPPLGAPVPPAATTRVESPDARWLLLVWPLVAGVLLLRLVRQRRALRRVGVRSPVEDDHAAVLATLAREAGIRRRVRLTRTTSMSSPITLGTWRPEICLPERALESLPPAQLRAMLAHEVAHVARHDDLWLRLTSAVASLLFFQPLNHVATRRLRDAAEVLCDEWAARSGEARLALARCLTTVAGWILERPAPRGVSAMAVRPSLLTHRIRRLVDEPHHAHPVRAGAAWALALLLPIAVLALAPGLAGKARAEPSTPTVVPTIDADLTALQHELTEVHDLLLDAGHDDLAGRLAERLRALRSKRATLAPPPAVEGR